jgi:cyanophycin synthetase
MQTDFSNSAGADSLMTHDAICRDSFIGQAALRLLCVRYFLRRAFSGRVRLSNRRMRASSEEFYRRAWFNAARAIGAKFSPSPGGITEIERGGVRIRVRANTTSLDSAATLARSTDKTAVRSLLARSSIPAPRQIVITIGNFDRALSMLRSSQRPLVVKPAANTGSGAGVSTGVTTRHQLRAAVAWARAFGPRMLIEEQLDGDCYRILMMDSKVLDVVLRHPPTIVGDGVSTVGQLMRRENRLRLKAGTARAQVLIRLDPDLRNTLAGQGLSLRSRPEKGQVVILKRVINDNGRRENSSAEGRLCPAIIEAARRAAETLGARLVGVDIICRDPSMPLKRSGGAILEVNTTPGFYYHYYKADGAFPVADHILNRIFAAGDH